ncbi:MAG: ABC transporter substrate-binding protein, partial [Nitrospinaceae bacterium]
TTDGRGAREGGVLAPDVTFHQLARPDSDNPVNGRLHPPYTLKTLARAIRQGLDPAGNALHPAMPRYTLAEADLKRLLAYLKVLGAAPVPGVTDRTVEVGIISPEAGPLNAIGISIQNLVTAYFDRVNRQGGIFGRKLALRVFLFDPQDPQRGREQIEQGFKDHPVLCFLGNLGLPQDHPANQFLIAGNIPVFVPLTISPHLPETFNGSMFFLYANLFDQGKLLVNFIAGSFPEYSDKMSLVFAEDLYGNDGAAGVRRQAEARGMDLAAELAFERGRLPAEILVKQLKVAGTEGVFFFGSGREGRQFLEEAARQGWFPLFCSSTDLMGTALLRLPAAVVKNIYMASPGFHAIEDTEITRLFYSLLKKTGTPRAQLILKRSAFIGAVLLMEGLRSSGWEVKPSDLDQYMRRLWKFQTGLAPALTFNENRHVGARGASITGIDPEKRAFSLVQAWSEPK